MNEAQIITLERVQQFLDATEAVSFTMNSKAERYRWIQHTLVRFRYVELSKAEKGVPPVPRGQPPRSLARRVTVPVGYISVASHDL